MTTVITFSHQNDASSLMQASQHRENLVLVVIIVLESKGFYCPLTMCYLQLCWGNNNTPHWY